MPNKKSLIKKALENKDFMVSTNVIPMCISFRVNDFSLATREWPAPTNETTD